MPWTDPMYSRVADARAEVGVRPLGTFGGFGVGSQEGGLEKVPPKLDLHHVGQRGRFARQGQQVPHGGQLLAELRS